MFINKRCGGLYKKVIFSDPYSTESLAVAHLVFVLLEHLTGNIQQLCLRIFPVLERGYFEGIWLWKHALEAARPYTCVVPICMLLKGY